MKAKVIQRLKAAGWRVRDGGRKKPKRQSCEARFDFCVWKSSDGNIWIVPRNDRARLAATTTQFPYTSHRPNLAAANSQYHEIPTI